MSSNLQRVALRPTSCRSHRPGNPHDLEQIGLARGFVGHGVLADIAIEAGEDSESRADRFLTSRMPGQLNAAGPDQIDARRRQSWPGDTVSGQPSNVPSGRPIPEHGRGAIPPRVLGSPRNHRPRGVGSLGVVPPFVLGLSRNHRRRGVGSSRFLRLFVLAGCPIIADAVSMAAARPPKPERQIVVKPAGRVVHFPAATERGRF